MLALAISLASACSWGIADFLGGIQSRRLAVLAVLGVSQPIGLVLALLAIPALGADPLSGSDVAVAFLAGAASIAALGAFYAAMAMGTISVVAPIAALGVVVPVVVGFARGEDTAAIQVAGLAVAIAGVVVLSAEENPRRRPVARNAILLAIGAAIGFGILFTGLDIASPDRPGWTIVAVRAGGLVAVAAALAVVRPSFGGTSRALPALFAIGFFGLLGDTLFAIASTRGLLPLVAVGASMYPVFTIALAHLTLGERLKFPQRLGAVGALAGVALIAAGG